MYALTAATLKVKVERVCVPDGLRVHVSGNFQAVETLHVADGVGQDLRGAHGGHLPAGLRKVAVHPQPRLHTRHKAALDND